MSTLARSIVRVAHAKLGRRDWMYNVAKGDFPANTNKCNLYVYDVMVEAGVHPPPRVSRYVILSRPPTAGEWADRTLAIAGWKIVTEPEPGDVVAEAHAYADATGHVGIVVGDKLTSSASALVGGQIVENDWGFRTDDRPTFRRCTR